ncbi:MAG TPA: hypothetical protein VFU49_07565 [Ktedonobacteraceae bacterium]|nr:hypothetical protein [Ktedonobacteraceae bacterium]
MASVTMAIDLSTLIDIVASGNEEQIIEAAREHLQQGEAPDVLLGRVAMVAAHGDPDGHIVTTLGSAAMLARYIQRIPHPLDSEAAVHERALPLFAQALLVAAPAVRVGRTAQPAYPEPFYPSGLPEGKTMNDMMHQAVYNNDPVLAERLLLGLYGTGADYRTMQVRAYEGIATTFQNAGHPLMFAVRGFQALDAVEWGDRAPNIIHWLAPHLPLRPDSDEPDWVKTVRTFAQEPEHSLQSIRTRLGAPKDDKALPLRPLILSNADTTQVCQGVYDALIKGGASRKAVGSVIALAASDLMLMVGDGDRDLFVRVAHGLLFSAAIRLVFQQVQDVEVLPLLFTSAAYVNALYQEIAGQQNAAQPQMAAAGHKVAGGGLIGISQLEALGTQLKEGDLASALTSVHRYQATGHDPRAIFGTIAMAASLTNATADQGHTLQIVQAVSEEFLAWPATLTSTNIEGLLQVALRAAAYGQPHGLISRL